MADKWPLANGNWSNAANWNGGTKPVAGDDVYADGKTVVIDESTNVATIRTTQRSGGTAGGGFTLNSGITVTATLIAGTTTCITRAAGAAESFIVGNLTIGGTTANAFAFRHQQANTTTITGNATAAGTGTTLCTALDVSNGIVNITGNVSGNGSNIGPGCSISGGTLNIVGNVVGGSGSVNSPGIQPIGGTINVFGMLIPNSAPAIGTPNINVGIVVNHTGDISASSNAIAPIGFLTYRIQSDSTVQHTYRVNSGGSTGVERSLYTGGVNLNQPTTNNVRKDIVYGASNEFTGTLAVADPAYVSLGVPTDNTVGTLQHLTLTQLQQALSPNAAVAVERSIDDTKAITFSWPVSGATITGEKSIDSGTYSAVQGSISFLRTESGRHYYTLAYNVDDRTTEEATIRYKMTDGTYTKYFNLRLVPPGITPQQIEDQLEDEFQSVLDAVGNIEVDNQAIAEAVRMELTDEIDIINNIPDSFDAIATQIDDISTVVYVSPAAFTSPGKITGRTLRPYYKDTSRIGPIGIADSTKTPVDLSAFEGDLYVSVMDSDTLEVLLYDDDPYFVTSNLYIDPSPESVGVLEAPLCWALRRISDNKTLMEGPWEVQFAAYGT